MLQIENEYGTPIEPNYFQNNNKHLQNPDNIQEKKIIPNKNLKEIQAQIVHIKTHQIKYNYPKKKFGQNHFI